VEARSFGRLALPLMDALFRTARRLTRCDADAKDLVQQTYLEAFRSVGTLADPARIRPWMYRILHNVWADDQKREHRRPDLELIDEPALVGNLEDELLRAGVSDDLAAALAALPAEFRWTVVLVDVEGLSYDEAAEVMGCPKGTVRSRLARARDALLARLQRVAAPAVREGGRA
jgi:RNA polymerase sigma factor (sigma-70 family)